MTNLKYMEGSLTGNVYKPNIEFQYKLAIPCTEAEEYALLIEHDGQNDANVKSMIKLADEGKAPYCVSVGVEPGNLPMPDGTVRNMRMNNYDVFDREYGDFLVHELIPHIEKTHGIHFSESPDMHFVSGGSSGGISAFCIAWFHSDYFHRVYMSSPSFLAMGRGNEIPYLIRKYETKPLRVYEECSEHEPNDYFGWSKGIDEEACKALSFANYDFKYAFFAGESHCSRYRDENEAYQRNAWIWSDWQNSAITAPGHSPRVSKVIPFPSKWEKCDAMPDKPMQKTPEILSGAYKNVVLSNDRSVWYAAAENDDVVHVFVDGNISLDKAILHATLHTIPRQSQKGAMDMAVDKTDRLFVLTEIGIQCVRSFGLIDVILELPDDSQPQEIAITDALYVRTQNSVYKRALCEDCVTDGSDKRKQVSYYD